jgi:very-short-patch-repair endonuclease
MEETEFEIITDCDEEKRELTTYSYISNYLHFEYFIGYEVASLLGYANPTKVITNNVSKCNQLVFRDYPGVKIPEIDPRIILITAEGAIEILLKTRKIISPDVLHILKKFNITTTNMKCLSKEQQCLYTIENVFKGQKMEDQFKVKPYYLDLYFPEYKIIVECDENGHRDRKPSEERERMDYVNEKLDIDDSYWIRFNPDEYGFDITLVCGKINRKMKEIHENTVKELVSERSVDIVLKRHKETLSSKIESSSSDESEEGEIDPLVLYNSHKIVHINYNDISRKVFVSCYNDTYYLNANSLVFKTHRLDKWKRKKEVDNEIKRLGNTCHISNKNKGTWISLDLVENFGEWLGTINKDYKGFGTYLKDNLVELYEKTKSDKNTLYLNNGFIRKNGSGFINVTDLFRIADKNIKHFNKTTAYKNYPKLEEHYISGNNVVDDMGIKVTFCHSELSLLMLNWIYKKDSESKTSIIKFITDN